MIDTIKFRIPIESDQLDILKTRCKSYTNKEGQSTLYVFYNKEVSLGSYDYHINLIVDLEDKLFIEFSAPQVYYGHNIYLLYPNKLPEVLGIVYQALTREFKVRFPHYKLWIVQRLDICYAWRFPSQELAYIALQILEAYPYVRKRPTINETGFSYIGSSYSVKVYMKHDEFKVHDRKRLKKLAEDYSVYLQDTSQGVLRIEASLKKEQVDHDFGRNITYESLLDTARLQLILNKYFFTMLRTANTEINSLEDIKAKLLKKYSNRKTLSLIVFHNYYFHKDPKQRSINRREMKSCNRSTLSRRLKQLCDAGVGIFDFGTKLEFNFQIPSAQVVNNEDEHIPDLVDAIFYPDGNVEVESVVKGSADALPLTETSATELLLGG